MLSHGFTKANKIKLICVEVSIGKLDNFIYTALRVNSPNSGFLLNIGNEPRSGPLLYSKAKGREAAHQFVMGPKAVKWLIIVLRGLNPVFGKHPGLGQFTL